VYKSEQSNWHWLQTKQLNEHVTVTSSSKAGGVRTYNSGLNSCAHALHLVGVAILEDLHCIRFGFFLVRTGFPLYLEQVNIDTIIWHRKTKDVAAIYKSLAVCNIATRSCCLLEFHFRTVGLVLQIVSLEEDTLVRHIRKYKFNMWSDQIHIPYLILWIRPVFNKGCPVFICNIFHCRCLGNFIVSLACKVSFFKVMPILSQSRLKNMSACLFSCIIFRIQLEPHLLKKECESY